MLQRSTVRLREQRRSGINLQRNPSRPLPELLNSILSSEVVALLLRVGADVTVMLPQRWTPLHFAARYGHHEAMRLLLSHCKEALHEEASNSNTPSQPEGGQALNSRFLAYVNAMTTTGETPLLLAAAAGDAVSTTIQHTLLTFH